MNRRTFLDYVLAMVCTTTALASIGLSVGNQILAVWPPITTVVGLLVSFGLSRAGEGKRWAQADVWIWTVLAFGTLTQIRGLNAALPEGGYPFQLIAAAWLTWTLMFCSFFCWRDGTMLFVVLPCLALFGLVGTFETFVLATPLFFVFLAAATLLCTRVQARTMQAYAIQAGAKDPDLLRQGAWRWMAGPEWALGSAFAVVLVSLMLAPLVQFSLKDVSNNVRVALPQPTTSNPAAAAMNRTDYALGRGAVQQSNDPMYYVKTDSARYLRQEVFTRYTGRGWESASRQDVTGSPLAASPDSLQDRPRRADGFTVVWPSTPPLEPIPDYETEELELTAPLGALPNILAPGPILGVRAESLAGTKTDGTGRIIADGTTRTGSAVVRYAVPPLGRQPGPPRLPGSYRNTATLFTSEANVADAVVEIAQTASRGRREPYARALALKEAIANRVTYTLSPGPTPANVDPVEHFLTTSREGYCDLYASAMTLGARALGLPARFVTGWLIEPTDVREDGQIVVRQRDYHAWCEVYFEGLGWVVFDATEGTDRRQGETDAERGDRPSLFDQAWTLWAVGGVLLLAVGTASVLLLRTRTGTIGKEGAVHAVARVHRDFARAIERRTGSPRRYSQTTQEYVRFARSQLGSLEPAAHELADRFDAAFFGPERPDAAALATLRSDVHAFAKVLKALPKEPGP